jgi:zinc transport system substrate-binding protein
MVRMIHALLSAFLVLGGACNTVAAADLIKVVVMIQPQRYFVEQLGGDRVAVTVLVPPGADPHTYEPKPQTLVEVSRAHVYIAIGIPEEEAWLPRLKSIRPDIPIVHQDQDIAKTPMETRAEIYGDRSSQSSPTRQDQHHRHDHDAIHHHTDGLDPHIWLSPKLARIQAETISRALCTLDSANCADYQLRLDTFRRRIDDLHKRLTKAFEHLDKHRSFLVVHPSWGYFARDYQLQQIPLEIEGKEPTAADLVKIIRRTAVEGIKVILVEPQFSQRFAHLLARESGVHMLIADPLALDWESSLWEVGHQLAAYLSRQP